MSTMDFVAGLPRTCRQHDSIWVIVDRFTKSAHFFPLKVSYSMEEYAKLYVKEIVKSHGSPRLSFRIEEKNSFHIFGDLSNVGLVFK